MKDRLGRGGGKRFGGGVARGSRETAAQAPRLPVRQGVARLMDSGHDVEHRGGRSAETSQRAGGRSDQGLPVRSQTRSGEKIVLEIDQQQGRTHLRRPPLPVPTPPG